MLKKVQSLFRGKPAHIKMYEQMVAYAQMRELDLISRKGHQLNPKRIGTLVGRQVEQDHFMGRK